jgi:hypothetical protein
MKRNLASRWGEGPGPKTKSTTNKTTTPISFRQLQHAHIQQIRLGRLDICEIGPLARIFDIGEVGGGELKDISTVVRVTKKGKRSVENARTRSHVMVDGTETLLTSVAKIVYFARFSIQVEDVSRWVDKGVVSKVTRDRLQKVWAKLHGNSKNWKIYTVADETRKMMKYCVLMGKGQSKA